MIKWISVRERLPDSKRPVLVWYPDATPFILCYQGEVVEWTSPDGDEYVRPTHWAELSDIEGPSKGKHGAS